MSNMVYYMCTIPSWFKAKCGFSAFLVVCTCYFRCGIPLLMATLMVHSLIIMKISELVNNNNGISSANITWVVVGVIISVFY